MGACGLDRGDRLRAPVRPKVIEHQHLIRLEPWDECRLDETHKALLVHCALKRAQAHRTSKADDTDHREVDARVGRTEPVGTKSSRRPATCSAHREVRSGLIEKEQLLGGDQVHELREDFALLLDVRALGFARGEALFLGVKPKRCRARSMDDGVTLGRLRLFQARVSSTTVASACDCTRSANASRSSMPIRGVWPPPCGRGSSFPVLRWSRTIRLTLASPTPKRSARRTKDPSPARYALRIRERRSRDSGGGIVIVDHNYPIQTTALCCKRSAAESLLNSRPVLRSPYRGRLARQASPHGGNLASARRHVGSMNLLPPPRDFHSLRRLS